MEATEVPESKLLQEALLSSMVAVALGRVQRWLKSQGTRS